MDNQSKLVVKQLKQKASDFLSSRKYANNLVDILQNLEVSQSLVIIKFFERKTNFFISRKKFVRHFYFCGVEILFKFFFRQVLIMELRWHLESWFWNIYSQNSWNDGKCSWKYNPSSQKVSRKVTFFLLLKLLFFRGVSKVKFFPFMHDHHDDVLTFFFYSQRKTFWYFQSQHQKRNTGNGCRSVTGRHIVFSCRR